ncbi:nuclear transport factor 2 family protein [Shimia haliotis]|uniref:DUF4440 domain-containing protein n=1 Tax=Shimia haliotis TaxID=1280847 RepID=A0A1I4AK25_9RHOB|nr:nuclear transport factor 2 family protein [Shimia haliotis]SFK56862.1 protein of unknown function [Shimia haliotis]
METSQQVMADLLKLETRVWEALVSGDKATDAALLTEDFIGVYPDGFAGKDAHVGQLDGGSTVAEYALSEVQLRQVSDGAAILIYRADYLRVEGSEREVMLVSSLWERRAGVWVNSFSQDTPLTGQGVV